MFLKYIKNPYYQRSVYLDDMEKRKVNFNMATIGKAVEAFVRSRAIRFGSFIVYEENGKVVKENPRTGEKTVLQSFKINDESFIGD